MKSEDRRSVRKACTEFLTAAADFYRVPKAAVRVLAARPLGVREGGWITEFFGDYYPENNLIRVWMRTAVRRRVTSFGTFLSTLCHEFCHHLDYKKLGSETRPTRAASTSVSPPTTTRAARRTSASSGSRCPTAASGSTGLEQTDPPDMRLRCPNPSGGTTKKEKANRQNPRSHSHQKSAT